MEPESEVPAPAQEPAPTTTRKVDSPEHNPAAGCTTHFQPMPALSADEYDALRADIAVNGVLVPVVKDQHGRILDGNHRAGIAAELGIDYPVILVEVTDEADAMDRAVSLNCSRRHLTREQVRVIIANEILRRPNDSDRAIARRAGCSPTTVGSVRAEQRAESRELTDQIRDQLDRYREQILAEAFMFHDDGYDFQKVGMVLEHEVRKELSKLDTDADDDALFGPVFGRFFDMIRAYDCHDGRPHCQVCSAHHRQWRDNNPRHVYQWGRAGDDEEVSNLDTSTESAGR